MKEFPQNSMTCPPQVTVKKQIVLVLDDDVEIRTSLETLLTARGYGFRAHAEPEDFFTAGQPSGPACLLLDHQLGNGVDGVQVYQKMRDNGWVLPTIFLTAHWNVQSVVAAIRTGVDGFLAKPFDPSELVAAVEHALRLSDDLHHNRDSVASARVRMATLTAREAEIVRLVLSGLLNKEIADQLSLALVTVKVHRGRAMKKLGAGNPAELAKIVLLAEALG
jgi:FixJ family two-component response regulator